MAWKFTSDKPLYTQIAESIITAVLSGEYAPGEQIPSVRQLAIEAAVNPNTIQHAFNELENVGIIVSKGTMGRYVTEDVAAIEKSRKVMAEKIIKKFLADISQLEIPMEEIISIIKEEKI